MKEAVGLLRIAAEILGLGRGKDEILSQLQNSVQQPELLEPVGSEGRLCLCALSLSASHPSWRSSRLVIPPHRGSNVGPLVGGIIPAQEQLCKAEPC